jgi:hypothetical protein
MSLLEFHAPINTASNTG